MAPLHFACITSRTDQGSHHVIYCEERSACFCCLHLAGTEEGAKAETAAAATRRRAERSMAALAGGGGGQA
eukprot:760614-Hanusia_phi.AAC.1